MVSRFSIVTCHIESDYGGNFITLPAIYFANSGTAVV